MQLHEMGETEQMENPPTLTSELYEEMLDREKFILTMQPELIREVELEDAEEVEEEQVPTEEIKLLPKDESGDRGESYDDNEVSIEEVDTHHQPSKDQLQRSLSLNTESATQLTLEMKKEADKDDQKQRSKTEDRWYIISCQSGRFGKYDPNDQQPGTDYLIKWQLFVMTLAIYNSFITPFQFSFEYVQQLLEKEPLNTIELIIDIIYMIDIVVGF